MDYEKHNQMMVERFLWLETLDPAYAVAALEEYRKDPNSPNPHILRDLKAAKARASAAT